jgi:hypothetical protein
MRLVFPTFIQKNDYVVKNVTLKICYTNVLKCVTKLFVDTNVLKFVTQMC